jgi:ketosteroid isomerase-like protein
VVLVRTCTSLRPESLASVKYKINVPKTTFLRHISERLSEGFMNEEEQLMELDRQWNEAYPKQDLAALDRIIADDWICIDGMGKIITKTQLLERIKSSPNFLDSHKFDEITLRVFEKAAIVTGRLTGTGKEGGSTFHLEQHYTRV